MTDPDADIAAFLATRGGHAWRRSALETKVAFNINNGLVESRIQDTPDPFERKMSVRMYSTVRTVQSTVLYSTIG